MIRKYFFILYFGKISDKSSRSLPFFFDIQQIKCSYLEIMKEEIIYLIRHLPRAPRVPRGLKSFPETLNRMGDIFLRIQF
jgi:hypothetical protein